MQIVLDVSEFQSVAQLDSLLSGNAPDEIIGVYIKATQDLTYRDAVALAFAKCCMTHNTPFGYYDFLTNAQVDSQAKYFQAFIATLPKADLVPMLDCEGAYSKFEVGVDNWDVAEKVQAVVYAQLSNMYQYTNYKGLKWVAQYDTMSNYIPAQGELAAYKTQGFTLWQYTSNYAGLNQDASALLGDFSALRAS